MRHENGNLDWGKIFILSMFGMVSVYIIMGIIAPVLTTWTVGIISGVAIAIKWRKVTCDLESITVTAMFVLMLYLVPMMAVFLFNSNILNRDFIGVTKYAVYTLTTLIGIFGIGMISYYNLKEKF